MKTLIIIPARLASVRLHKKLLLQFHGLEIILWVARAVMKTGYDFIVAVDDVEIGSVLQKEDVPFVMTSQMHLSGTSRSTEVRDLMPGFQYYCVVQGDEPFLSSSDIQTFINKAIAKKVAYVQAITKFSDCELPTDISNVKVVLTKSGKLLYASRSLIPYSGDGGNNLNEYLQISGLYLFSNGFLQEYKSLPVSPLEKIEKVEQLRCLYSGIDIDTVIVDHGMQSIDTHDDYIRLQKMSYVNNNELFLR